MVNLIEAETGEGEGEEDGEEGVVRDDQPDCEEELADADKGLSLDPW